MPRNALIFFAILANRRPRRLDQSANCTVLYKGSPWLWEVVGVQSQGSSSFKRISALKNSSSSKRISLLNSLEITLITRIYEVLQLFCFIFIINGESQICIEQELV